MWKYQSKWQRSSRGHADARNTHSRNNSRGRGDAPLAPHQRDVMNPEKSRISHGPQGTHSIIAKNKTEKQSLSTTHNSDKMSTFHSKFFRIWADFWHLSYKNAVPLWFDKKKIHAPKKMDHFWLTHSPHPWLNTLIKFSLSLLEQTCWLSSYKTILKSYSIFLRAVKYTICCLLNLKKQHIEKLYHRIAEGFFYETTETPKLDYITVLLLATLVYQTININV